MTYRRLAFAFASLLIVALVAGCGGASPSATTSSSSSTTTTTTTTTPTGPTANTGAALRVYVVQQPPKGAAATILQFAATATGSVSPASTITPGTVAAQVNTDQYGNLYYFSDHIVELASGASGSPTSMREIQAGNVSRICCVDGMGVSPSGAVVLGQDSGEIDEWSATATGTVAPTRYILGFAQTGGSPLGPNVANQVTVDASDTLYVANAGLSDAAQILLYGSTTATNAAPARSLGPTNKGAAGGVAVDSAGSVYTTTTSCTSTGTGASAAVSCAGAISVYAATTMSTATPTRVITGSATLMRSVWGIKVDAVGNMYVVTSDPTGANPAVLKFAAGAVGNVAPVSSFTSAAWTTPDFNPSIAIY